MREFQGIWQIFRGACEKTLVILLASAIKRIMPLIVGERILPVFGVAGGLFTAKSLFGKQS